MMSDVKSRREFLRGIGLVSAVAVGAVAYNKGLEIEEEKKDISHLAPLGTNTLQLTADNEPPKPTPYPYVIMSNQFNNNANKVTMSVGKDDRLWIKTGDQWRRVALES